MIGKTISHYRIVEKLGEGGMGIVYKARDTTLDRDVALKFLPPHLSASEADKARFMQEAKAASALNHPNVCTIYAVEEHDHQLFIAMEFVDGQTLRDLVGLTHGSTLPLKRAIDIGIQIADGLAAAHEKGIVHRDIKPENIMIRKDGIAQIMDFGLAKLRATGSKINRLTKEGSTVGTAGYMSPEQIQGLDADHRSDIFSLGVLLYELFTGQLPFRGVHETALAYEIVNVDPAPMSSVKPDIDPALDAIVLECLEKDPRERMQSSAQISIDLKRVRRESSRQRHSRITSARPVEQRPAEFGPAGTKQPGTGKAGKMKLIPWMLASLFLISTLALLYIYSTGLSSGKTVIRANINPPAGSNFHLYGNNAGPVVLSHDGKHIAFVATDSAGRRFLYVRAMDELLPRRLSETDGASEPFWSPDSRFIAYAAKGKLKKIDVAGGASVTICDAPFSRGGTWGSGGSIVFAPGPAAPLVMVSAGGGTATQVTTLDSLRRENSHRWPSFLPDGKHFLYLARTVTTGSKNEGDAICIGSVDGKVGKVLARTSSNAQFASGYLIYTRGGNLVAQRMDQHVFELTGEPVTIADSVAFDQSIDRSMFTVSDNGVLIYQTGAIQVGSKVVFADRSGKQTSVLTELAEYYQIRFSPDGNKFSCYIYDFQSHNADIWIHDLIRGLKTRFTFTPTFETYTVWSPDGSGIIYSANSAGKFDLYEKPADGGGSERLLFRSGEDKSALDWSSDGKHLLFISNGDSATQADLWILPLAGDKKPVAFLKTEFNERDARFSPDAKWVAYESDESGQNEIYIRPFPDHGSKRQVSIAGGDAPRWRKDGKELYYYSPDNKMMAAEISSAESTVEVANVHPLFEVPAIVAQPFPDYDVTGNGSKFILNVPFESQNSNPLILIVNWNEGLKEK